jgi:phytoene desaturase (3,4-didehydrolycopene-forming)
MYLMLTSIQRFDQGPSLLLLPHLFRETYRDLDTTLEDEDVELLKCEPNYHVWFGDGESFRMSSDIALMKSEIEKWEGKDGFERYLSYLQEAHRHYELSVTHVLRKNFTSLLSMCRPSFLRHVLQLHPFESIYNRASRYFWTERMRRVFTFGSMYMGMSPFDAPGTYSLLQYTELAEGIWYPRGGFHKVIEGLVNIGKRFGVEYHLSAEVANVKLSADGRKVQGVVLKGGTTLEADLVICNADLVYAYNNLIPQTSYATSLRSRKTSCSSISFYWAIDRIVPQLNAHNIFLADEYQSSFDSIFKEHLIPKDPSFYVNVPSRVDPSAAPTGRDSIVVLVPVGHLLSDDSASHKGTSNSSSQTQDWPRLIALAREKIIGTIKQRTGVDLSPMIIHEQVNDPVTWKDNFNLDRGGILGLSHSFFNVLSFRPKTKHASIENLYFVGASTHPGTGVPICLAGGKIVATQVLDDAKMKIPWSDGGTISASEGKDIRELDVVNKPLSLVSIVVSSLVFVLLALAITVQWLDPATFNSFSDRALEVFVPQKQLVV